MKAMILAAGLGSRLKHITTDIPKALVPVGNRPILAYQLEALVKNNIKDVTIVLGYNAHCIPEYLDKNPFDLNIRFVTNSEYNTSNSSYSFWLAHDELLGDSYIHLNCDIIFKPSLLKKIIESPYENVIAIRKDIPLGGHLEHVSLDGDVLKAMSITQLPDSVGKAFGLAKFGAKSSQILSKLIEKLINKGDKNQHYYGLIRKAAQIIPYYVLDGTHELLLEVNTLEDLAYAQTELEKQ